MRPGTGGAVRTMRAGSMLENWARVLPLRSPYSGAPLVPNWGGASWQVKSSMGGVGVAVRWNPARSRS